jgi:TRAP-type C4-dicarboxylate transport system substrate-binding protein
MHFQDAAKYVTETGQSAIFGLVEVSKKWHDSLPPDLQQVIDKDAAAQALTIYPQAASIDEAARQTWLAGGGELISLPTDEQVALFATLAGVGGDVTKAKPELNAAYRVVTEAAARAR